MQLKINQFPIFAFLWAMAIFIHVGKWNTWLTTPMSFLVGILAVGILLKPNSVGLFLGLIIAQFFQAFQTLPWIANHWFLTGFVHLTIFFAFLRSALSYKTFRIDGEKFYSIFAPAARWLFLAVYVVAFFHKLNRDWFDPSVSCGALMYLNLAKILPFLPTSPWAQIAAIYGTLIFEAVMPIFLILPRLRVAGIIMGIVIHFVFGIAGYFGFSSTTLALLFLFAPDNFRLPEIVQRFFLRSPWQKIWALAGAGIVSFAALVFWKSPWRNHGTPPWSNLVWDLGHLNRSFLSYVFEAFWWVYGPCFLLFFIWVLRQEKLVVSNAKKLLRLPYKSFYILPLLFLLNGFSPYLGLKTGTTFSMYSNLRVAEKKSNHLFFRRGLDLFGYSGDLVKVLSSSDPELQEVADKGYLLPYFEFKSYLSQKVAADQSDFRLNYVRGGKETTVKSVALDPEFSKPYPIYLRKLLYFRPIPIGEKCPCQN